MKRLFKKLAMAGATILALAISPASAQIFVNCDEGGSIQDALDAQDWAPRADVEFSGTCYEFVTVRSPRASIVGQDGAAISGQVRIFGPSNVLLKNLTILGPGQGVLALGGRTRLTDVNLQDNAGFGVLAQDGATVRMNGGYVRDNGGPHGIVLRRAEIKLNGTHVYNHPDFGIEAIDNSRVFVAGGSIGDHLRGIVARMNSSVRTEGTQVTDNILDGFNVSHNSSATVIDTVVTRNGSVGIDINFGSTAEIIATEIFDNGEVGLFVENRSLVRVDETEIVNNGEFGVQLIDDSRAMIMGLTHIPDHLSGWAVYCAGEKSSLKIDEESVVGQIKCSGRKYEQGGGHDDGDE